MRLRKITLNNSVRYIPVSAKTKKRDSKPTTMKAGSLPRKQNKNISQNSKKLPKKLAASGVGILRWIMNCYL